MLYHYHVGIYNYEISPLHSYLKKQNSYPKHIFTWNIGWSRSCNIYGFYYSYLYNFNVNNNLPLCSTLKIYQNRGSAVNS